MRVGWHAWQLKTGETMTSARAAVVWWVCSGIKLGLVEGDFELTAAKLIFFYVFDRDECAQVHPKRFRVQGLGSKVWGLRMKGLGVGA